MKKKLFLLSMLTVATLASCDKNEGISDSDANTGNAVITVNTGTYGGDSRSLGDISTETAPAFDITDGATLYQLNGAGNPFGTKQITFTNPAASAPYTSDPVSISGAVGVMVAFNDDNGTLTHDVNTRQGNVTGAGASVSKAVRLTGVGTVGAPTGGTSTASVEISPEMARIEVTAGALSIPSGPTIVRVKNVAILGAYVNNIHMNRTATALVKSDVDSTPTWAESYASSGTKSMLYDLPTAPAGWVLVDANEAVTSTTNYFDAKSAIGYNIFPQDGGVVTPESTHPHMIFKVSCERFENGEFVAYSGYLNITKFKDENGANYITSFERGNIYAFSMDAILDLIVDKNTPITPNPDPDASDLTISVSVKSWNVIPVTPEI